MYTAQHFSMPDDEARRVLAEARFGTLVTVDGDGTAQATPLPMLYRPGVDTLGSIAVHVARPNDQWRHGGSALVLVDGPNAYVSPSWYAQPEHSAPTWNYQTVQVRGELRVHDDPQWLLSLVTELSERHEHEWSVDLMDTARRDGMLRGIVGIEVVITEVVGKQKLSQNKSSADIALISAGLREQESIDDVEAVATLMERFAVPHAQRREGLVAEARGSQNPDSRPRQDEGSGRDSLQY